VLLAQSKSGFKLIDFGSATTVAVTPGEDMPVALVDEELEKYTTMQVCATKHVGTLFSASAVSRARDGRPVPGTPDRHQG
jgi:hypothetical protein